MHSSIFLVKDCKEENTYLIDEDSVFTFADYFDKCNSDEETHYLNSLNRTGISVLNKRIKITDKKGYFEKKYDYFKKSLDKVFKWSFEDFINNKVDLFELSYAYNHKYNIYIQYQNYLYTLDEFMRNFNEGDTFEITDIYDYHC